MGFSPNLKVNQGLINDSQLYSLNLFLHKKNIVAKTVFQNGLWTSTTQTSKKRAKIYVNKMFLMSKGYY